VALRRRPIARDSLLAEVEHLTGWCVWAMSICIKHEYGNETYVCDSVITTSIPLALALMNEAFPVKR
jgi:hypothetical protein